MIRKRQYVAHACILYAMGTVFFLISPSCQKRTTVIGTVQKILIYKEKRQLILVCANGLERKYAVSLGRFPRRAKERQGDGRTPEGIYHIDYKNSASKFYRALHLSYPSLSDLAHARQLGVLPGGDIEIHGLPPQWGWLGGFHRLWDWTDGCIALTNTEMDELWNSVQPQTPVYIYP